MPLGRLAPAFVLLALLLYPQIHALTSTYTSTAQQAGSDWWYGTIIIREDGSVDPPDAPVVREGNVYRLTKNVKYKHGAAIHGIIILRDNIVVDGAGHAIEGSNEEGSAGVYLAGRRNVTLKNLNIQNFETGIYLHYSSSNVITNNTIIENNRFGVYLYSSSGNVIAGNRIAGNNVSGIVLWESSGNVVANNNIENSRGGVSLFHSSGNIVGGNVFVNSGLFVWDSYGNVVENNTVNGKPLVYLEGVSGYTVTGEAGQVVLVKCTNIRVEGLTITNTDTAVLLWMTNNAVIASNTIVGNNRYGIYLHYSSSNTITGNRTSGNDWGGIYLRHSSNNTITDNNIENNREGIALYYSSNNTIAGNRVAGNRYGIIIYYSLHNLIYNNVFVNEVNAIVGEGDANYWSVKKAPSTNIVGGPYLGGNYWSSFSETCTDSDGDLICDQPYVINSNNVDRYPLAKPRDFATPMPVTPPIHLVPTTYIIGALIAAIVVVLAAFALKKLR